MSAAWKISSSNSLVGWMCRRPSLFEADRNSKALFASSGTHPLEPPSDLGAGHPDRAPRRQAVHGAAWLGLVLDRRRRLGEGSASGVPWGDGLGKGDWEGLGG